MDLKYLDFSWEIFEIGFEISRNQELKVAQRPSRGIHLGPTYIGIRSHASFAVSLAEAPESRRDPTATMLGDTPADERTGALLADLLSQLPTL